MSTHQKDARMVDDLEQSSEVRSLLRAGIDDDIATYDFEAGLAKHMAAVAALPPAAGAPHLPPAAAAAGMSGKALLAWIGVPVASASVIAALWLAGSSPSSTAVKTNTQNSVATTVPIAATPVAELPPVAAAPVAIATEPSVAPKADAAPTPRPQAIRAQRNAATVTRDVTREAPSVATIAPANIDTAPSAPEASSAIAATTNETQPVERVPTAAERDALARQAAAQAEQERAARENARLIAEARLKREMTQLMQATQSLTSNPARSLALTQAGEQEFHGSLFSEERQHVLLLALIKLGRLDEAERRAVPYLSAHPDSPFARRVRNALRDAR
jgi:hypothetical protein